MALADRLTSALDGIGAAILVYGADGEAAFSNQAAERLLSDHPSGALVSQVVGELIDQALAGGRAERRLDLIAPARRSLAIRAFPTEGMDGPDGAVVVLEDISERLRLEAVRRDFVANVSHELKTPTGALTLLAETVEGETDPEVIGRLVRRMGGEAERLSRIIDDLLDLSRIEVNEAPARTAVPVGDFVHEAVGSLGDMASGLGVSIEVADVPDTLAIAGDRRDLVSAVKNLVDNAIKYSEADGVVRVDVASTGSRVTISISDSGIGIPAHDTERIFERFYRVDRARSRHTGGTGLGLAIVRHVANNHGGTVTVRSVEGEGSTFVLALPAVWIPEHPTPEGTDVHAD